MLGGRDPLDIRCKVHALLLVVQVVALRNEKPILDRIMEGREFMNVDMIDVLTPTDRGGGPQLPLKVELAQVELENRRAVFNRRADKGLLIHLRDSRLKLHLHSYCHPTPLRYQRCAMGYVAERITALYDQGQGT